MSIKVMSLVWDHFPGGPNELVLALALADWAGHDGRGIWASVATMAAKARQSESSVHRHIAAMRASGWLEEVKKGGGRGRATSYRIPIERIPPGSTERVSILHPLPKARSGDNSVDNSVKGASREAERVPTDAEKGATVTPHTLVTTSVKIKSSSSGGGRLIYPPNLSAAQQESMRAYLEDLNPRTAQNLLDELAGLLKAGMNGSRVRDAMAVFAALVRQQEDGTLVLSHAHRIQVEREGAQ